jgi:hypothetical protein
MANSEIGNAESFQKIRDFMGDPTDTLTTAALACGFSNKDVALGYVFAMCAALMAIEDRDEREKACNAIGLAFEISLPKAIEGE